MNKLLNTIVLTVLLATAILPQTGCGGDTGETEPVASESNRWLELLEVIPENEITLSGVYLQDFAHLMDKVEQYPGVTGRYALSHISGDSRSALFSRFNPIDPAIADEYRKTVGFTLEDIKQMITSGENPQAYEAYRGSFNKTDIDNAVKTGPMNDQLETVQYGDYEFYSWGEDNLANLEQRSSVRPLGRGHRLALVDDFVFWMTWTEGIEYMIDSYSNKVDSLADVEEYRLLVAGLATFDVTHAYFSKDANSYAEMKEWLELFKNVHSIDSDEQQRIEESIEDTPLLKPYQAFATGAGLDEDGYFLAIVLLNPDDNTANKNVPLLERRIKETRSVWQENEWANWINDMSIKSEGKLTTAKLHGAICEFWWERFEKLDPRVGGVYEPLLLHE
jgi:hypothetical protein